MVPKKRPQPLHVSLQLIEAERVNMAKRTKQRIAVLLSQTKNTSLHQGTQTEISMYELDS